MNQDLSKRGWMGLVENGDEVITINGTNGLKNISTLNGNENVKLGETAPLMFDIVSTQIIEDEGPEKKYVLYSVRVQHGSARADLHSTTVERRYTDFLTLYEDLRRDFPDVFSTYSFPRKALMGNYTQKLIVERSQRFEALLNIIAQDSKLRNSRALLTFLQEKELRRALEWCGQQRYDLAEPLLKTNFRLLNKVYTDRSPAVLLALCRLVGCYARAPESLNNSPERWVTLALHRYEGVSDADLLSLYGPLLETCVKMCERIGTDRRFLEDRLADMKRRGMNLSNKELMEAVDDLEKKINAMPNSSQ